MQWMGSLILYITILTKVVPDNLKACLRFVQHSNNYAMVCEVDSKY